MQIYQTTSIMHSDITKDFVSRTNDRACYLRAETGEESPGFTGQDAG